MFSLDYSDAILLYYLFIAKYEKRQIELFLKDINVLLISEFYQHSSHILLTNTLTLKYASNRCRCWMRAYKISTLNGLVMKL